MTLRLVESRRAWLDLTALLGAIANRVREGAVISKVDGAPAARLVITFKADFPLDWVSAAEAAKAFLVLARGFVAAGYPVATAGFVAAGAECLERMLLDDSHAAAAESRRRMGDSDDD